MGKKALLEFVRGQQATVGKLREFCAFVVDEEFKHRPFTNPPHFKIQILPVSANGYVQVNVIKSERRYRAVINLHPFLRHRKERSPAMTYFYLCTTIVHELEHIRLMEELMSEKVPQYQRFFASLRQVLPLESRKSRVYNGIITIFDHKNRKRRKGIVALDELVCTQIALQRAYEIFRNDIAPNERKTIQNMIESIRFLCEHIEIDYASRNRPYNRFVKSFTALYQLLVSCPELLHTWKQANYVFDANMRLLSIDQLIQLARSSKTDFYDEFLIRCFISLDIGWEKLFEKDPSAKEYLERLANEYCKKCIFYLKNIHLGELYLSAQILQDNAAMLIKNTQQLNILMEQFNMRHTVGSIIPLYRV